MRDKIFGTIVVIIMVTFVGWLVKMDSDFNKSCFEAGGITAKIGSGKYCIPKDTEYMMRQ